MTRIAALALLLVAVLAGCTSRSGTPVADSPAATTPGFESAGSDPDDPCQFVEDGQDAPVGLPPAGDAVEGTAVLTTNHGELPVELAPADAPCTVRSFVHLVEEGFYDGIDCHRLTTHPSLQVLQCGDPNGDGSGGPGYTIPDELPTDLPAGPDGAVTYPRGTVAMANAGPNTGGSQFFLVYADSTLPPDYAVFGVLDQTGLGTLDVVAAGGVAPGGMTPGDGAPALPVRIESGSMR